MKFLNSLFKITFCVMSLFSQDLPIQNGELEQTSEIGFSFGQINLFMVQMQYLMLLIISNCLVVQKLYE